MQVSADGQPMVSYYDATNKKLKLAVLVSAEERSWKTITLKEQPGADIGRYSKMVIVGGKPVIAFLQIEPGNGGKTRSKVVVARANIEVPQEAVRLPLRGRGGRGGQPLRGDDVHERRRPA